MSRLYDVAERVEHAAILDRPAEALARLSDIVTRQRGVRDVLSGTWLGHALHPLLTDFPLGSWMSASFLDLFGPDGSEEAAERLLGFGLVMSLPTVASGLADWNDSSDGPRRAGVVHAAVNTGALALYATSLVLRRRDHRPTAVAVGVLGGLVATVGGYFGGHLSLTRGVGGDHTAYDPRPADGDRCPRCGAGLTIAGDRLRCPDDGSEFDRRSGRVVRGPSPYPTPVGAGRPHPADLPRDLPPARNRSPERPRP